MLVYHVEINSEIKRDAFTHLLLLLFTMLFADQDVHCEKERKRKREKEKKREPLNLESKMTEKNRRHV